EGGRFEAALQVHGGSVVVEIPMLRPSRRPLDGLSATTDSALRNPGSRRGSHSLVPEWGSHQVCAATIATHPHGGRLVETLATDRRQTERVAGQRDLGTVHCTVRRDVRQGPFLRPLPGAPPVGHVGTNSLYLQAGR